MRPEDVCFLKMFGTFLGFALLIAFILILLFIWQESIGSTPKIKFKSFKNFYELNPDRWRLHDDTVGCKIDFKSMGNFNICINDDKFHFGFIDFYRYKLWKNNLDKRKENKRKAQITARMVAAVKQDIETNEKKAQQYQDEAVQTLWTVLNRSEK